MTTNTAVQAPPQSALGAGATGLRLGALFGPVIFGVTAAGVALPDVAQAMEVRPAVAGWVLTAHALALGVGTAFFGRLSEKWGVRNTLLVGSIFLAVGAALCLLAPNFGTLIAGRFVQAAGSGAITSSALTLASAAAPAQRAKILGIFGASMALFSSIATLMGGMVTDWMHWRLTLVLPALSLLLVPFCLELAATRPGFGKATDLVGGILLGTGATSLLLLIQASSLDLATPLVITLAALGVLSVAGLVMHIGRRPDGFVPRQLATDRTFLTAALVGLGGYAGLFAAMYAVPQILTVKYGWSVFMIGAWLLPGAVVGAVFARVASKLTVTKGGSILLAGAALSSAVFLGIVGIVEGGIVVMLVGTSMGMATFAVTQVITTAVLSSRLEPLQRGGAMGVLNLLFFVGGGIGSATAGTLSEHMDLTSALAVVAILPLLAGLLALLLPPAQAQQQA
ncbi:bagremycin/ferroverdin transporter BagJ/FevB [Streptomyces sp. NPDC052236]|uniref:bagremycin/ferroverdin transporter BagJ/FevB n=1 Tax=Streptomyces sp. NPDC052236 TaxID=3365686 RepID=UPI0037D6B0AA